MLAFMAGLFALMQDFCPCENSCNNQMFTRKQYAKLSVVSKLLAEQAGQHG